MFPSILPILCRHLAAACTITLVTASAAQAVPRERVSFNDGWRFIKGDPDGAGDQLAYQNIKPWITNTGSADRSTVRRDGNDLAFVTVTVADTSNSPVPGSKNQIDFAIEGPGKSSPPTMATQPALSHFRAHNARPSTARRLSLSGPSLAKRAPSHSALSLMA